MEKEKEITTIRLTRKTKQLLADFGKKDDSYEEIILRLIEERA